MKIAFFGVPLESTIVLDKLDKNGFDIVCVVTKPPRPIGRKKELIPTPVADWANAHHVPLLTFLSNVVKPWLFADEDKLIQAVLKYKPDILISADYTQKIPIRLIRQVKFGGLNVHPSLLPAYRGPAPVPWAILRGETETGVSIVTLTEKFDQGQIVAQVKEPILSADTTPVLLNRLFSKGADLLIKLLPDYSPNTKYKILNTTPSYFPRFTRDDGFIPWEIIKSALTGQTISLSIIKQYSNITIVKYNKLPACRQGREIEDWKLKIERAWRALHPWPGIWTKVKINGQEKRLKILSVDLSLVSSRLSLKQVQLEGKKPVRGNDLTALINLVE